MRQEFIREIAVDRGEHRPWLIVGDLGWNAVEPFVEAHPERFVNAGVAEQSMISLAAGIAVRIDDIVFAYSIANFPTFRCLEQIRNDVAYPGNPVAIVALGAGFSYGTLGFTHFGIEDLSVMRAVPGIDLFCPCDAIETTVLTRHIVEARRPAYIRLGRIEDLGIVPVEPEIMPGRFRLIASGNDVAIIATGAIVREAVMAREVLARHGLSAAVYSAHTIRPVDEGLLVSLAQSGQSIVTVEEHRVSGGLASEVLEASHRLGLNSRQLSVGVDRLDHSQSGSRRFMLERHGLDGTALAARVSSWLGETDPQFGRRS